MAIWGESYFLLSMFLFLIMLLHVQMLCTAGSRGQDTKDYVVYMGATLSRGDGKSEKAPAYTMPLEMLESLYGSTKAAKESLKYIYGKSFGGFAATLSPSHVHQLSKMDGVVSVFESKKLETLTTRSWDFIGFPASAQRKNLDYQSDIIIGILDTGIWPESDSFTDTGFGPIPSKWRGGCQTSSDFPASACNKKLVGAKCYRIFSSLPPQGTYFSPRDWYGHGTHTSSTATGNFVKNASVFGIAQGESRGGVPGARVAMYKTCWPDGGCDDADILAAFDDAIYDGVDIISVSLGSSSPLNYFEDGIAIGAFHAMKKGILVSNSGGNDGPSRKTVSNYSPWSLTVAASTIDRKMDTKILLGNNISLQGISVNTYTMEKAWYPLVYGGDAPNVSGGFTSDNSRTCQMDSLDQINMEGKIVVCYLDFSNSILPDYSVFLAGGAGVIIIYDGDSDAAITWFNPAALISTKHGITVLSYINSTSSPVANIQKTTTPKAPASIVASFSSRGFNPITLDILKPDITAPGVNILASWVKSSSITGYLEDKRFSNFKTLSGTSMSCPHAAGSAGFVKSHHKDWSPAAIKSALMTTAFVMDETLPENADAEFGYGAGQINPMKAVDPGLVYDTDVDDYIDMLCMEGYNDTTLRLVTGDFSSCDLVTPSKNGARELNYPSIMAFVAPGKAFEAKFPRTVTNVGAAESEYKAIVSAPYGINVTVEPDTLSFSSLNQKLSYNVTIQGGSLNNDTLLSGALTWSYGNLYAVRSPITVYALSM